MSVFGQIISIVVSLAFGFGVGYFYRGARLSSGH